MHSSSKLVADTNHHIAEDDLPLGGLYLNPDNVLVLYIPLSSLSGSEVNVTLGNDDALRKLYLATGTNQLAASRTSNITTFTNRSIQTNGTGISCTQLYLVCAAAGAKNRNVCHFLFGANNSYTLVGSKLARLAQHLLNGQFISCTKQGFQSLFCYMHMTCGSFYQNFHNSLSFLSFFQYSSFIVAHLPLTSRIDSCFCNVFFI